jgi:hypothetical protein
MKLWKMAALAAIPLLLLEAGMRVVGLGAPLWYRIDPQTGWSLRPNKLGWYLEDGKRNWVSINRAGFRDGLRTVNKPDGNYRVAILGDEYSEAMALPRQATWWSRLGRELESCMGKRVEVANFAVRGFGTTQESVLLESTVMRYRPDLVLVQFSPRDDVVQNSYRLARERERPFHWIDARGVMHLDETFLVLPDFDRRMQTRWRLGEEIAEHSRVFQVAWHIANIRTFADEADPRALEAPADANWEEAWRVTERVLAEMRDFATRNGARFAVVPAPALKTRGYPERRLSAFAQLHGVKVLDTWTAEGHAALADAAAQQLCTRLSGDSRYSP